MTDELKPVKCGCGGEAVLETDHDTIQPVAPIDWKRVRCNKCNIRTTWRKSEAAAIEAWNRAMGAENICENCKEYIFDETCEGWCRCDDEYPTPRKYGCNCFERRCEHE